MTIEHQCRHLTYSKIYYPNTDEISKHLPVLSEAPLVHSPEVIANAIRLVAYYRCVCFTCNFQWREMS